MVPAPLRAAIEASYPTNPGPQSEPSAEFLAIAQGAIDAVVHKEARNTPRKAPEAAPTTCQEPSTTPRKTTGRRRRKALQLALFELDDS